MRRATLILILAALALLPLPARAEAPVIPCAVIAEHPHDPGTSTQGLFYLNGLFYESSGGWGRSFVTVSDPGTGRRLKTTDVDPHFFAEGIAPGEGVFSMLTWKSGIGLTFGLKDLDPRHRFAFAATGEDLEGWGLARDEDRYILSSGTARLEFRAPGTFARTGTITVRDGDAPVRLLNELEMVDGWLYANVWKSDRVAVIDIGDGAVRAWLDLAPLRARLAKGSGVANGIAWDRETGRLWVTGKKWDKVFEIGVPVLR